MKVIKYQLFIAVALLVGVAIGYFAGEPAPVVKEPTKEEPGSRKEIPDKGEAATIAALRRQVAGLQKALAERGEKTEVAVATEVADRPQERGHGERRNPREWLEEMKKNDPERYVQMTNRFAQWRRSRAEQARSTLDFLSSIDTSRMSEEAKGTHKALQELLAKREEIEDRLHQENLSDEDRGRLMEEMREAHHQMMHLNAAERKNLLEETARTLGFEGEDVKDITATIQDVIRVTDGGWGPPRHRGGGPRGPGGPGGR